MTDTEKVDWKSLVDRVIAGEEPSAVARSMGVSTMKLRDRVLQEQHRRRKYRKERDPFRELSDDSAGPEELGGNL